MLLSEDKRNLFVVNAGSNEVSVFRVRGSGDLRLIQTIGSGGGFPVSLTIDDDLLYVLNAGGAGNIVGYKVQRNGTLSVINESIRSLGLNNPVFPDGTKVPLTLGQVGFDRKNRRLIITNAGDRELLVFDLNRDGIPEQTPSSTRSEGDVPFDFVIARNGCFLYVINAGTGDVSAYRVNRRDGGLRFLNASAGLPNFSDNGVTPQGIAVR